MTREAEPAVAPDPVVEAALRLLPVPPHGRDFWPRLHQALGAETIRPLTASVATAAGAAAAAGPDPALALVPPALRRPSNVVLAAVAAAAVLVVAFATASLVEDREGTEEANATSELNALLDRAQSESATPVTLADGQEERSTEAVMAWVSALGEGDAGAAWSALSDTAQREFGTEQAFEADLAAMAETYAPWAASEPEQVLVTPIATSEDDTLAIVTLVGATSAEAFAVRFVEGDAFVEPFARAGQVELVVPAVESGEAPPVVEEGDSLVVVVPDGVDAPVLRLDDGPTLVCGEADGTQLTPLDDLPARRCEYDPADALAAGRHTLTVAFWTTDGVDVSTDSVLFEAA